MRSFWCEDRPASKTEKRMCISLTHLYEIVYLSDGQAQMFISDFKIAADYFVFYLLGKSVLSESVRQDAFFMSAAIIWRLL